MHQLTRRQKKSIGFQYILDALSPFSAYGSTMVKAIAPLKPGMEAELERQYRNIAQIIKNRPIQGKLYGKLEGLLRQVKDLRSTIERCRKEILGEVELFQLKGYLLVLEEMEPVFAEIGLEGVELCKVTPALDILDPDKSRIAAFYVSEQYSPELAEIRRQKKALEELLRCDRNNQALLLRRTNLVYQEEAEEQRVRAEICSKLAPWLDAMLHNAHAIGEMDLTLQKTAVAQKYGGIQPKLGEDIAFEEMRNPQVADDLIDKGKNFIPITIRLKQGATVITGANMGGKSITLKTVALNVLLAVCGFFPFAKTAEICLPSGFFFIAEDLEDCCRDLSSFGGEIMALKEICHSGGEGALILIDELARSTNPDEGAVIARAVTRYLNGRRDFSLLTTHYDGVVQYSGAHYQVIGLCNANLEVLQRALQEQEGIDPVSFIARHMDYGLVPIRGVQETPKDAIRICKLLGLDEEIISWMECP